PLEGQSLAPAQQQMVNILAGQTSGLAPVLFMTGSPQPGPGPHPSLMIDLDFDPGSTRVITWTLAAQDSAEDSFDLARRTPLVRGMRNAPASNSWTRVTCSTSAPAIQTGTRRWRS